MSNTQTDSGDELDGIFKEFLIHEDGWDEAKFAIRQFMQARAREAEGRGRIAVISAVKDWADATELTYQQLMQAELDKTKQLNPQAGDGGEV